MRFKDVYDNLLDNEVFRKTVIISYWSFMLGIALPTLVSSDSTILAGLGVFLLLFHMIYIGMTVCEWLKKQV